MDSGNKRLSRKKTTPRIVPDSGEEIDIPTDQDTPGSSLQNDFIALSVRRSAETLNLSFYNPHFQSQQDYDNQDETEIQSFETEEEGNIPIYLMFPNLKKSKIHQMMPSESTTTVTKMLVGQKADFSLLKPRSKKIQFDSTLLPVPEISEMDVRNEQYTIEGDSRRNSSQFMAESMSNIDNNNNLSEIEENVKPRRKQRKKIMVENCQSNSENFIHLPYKRKTLRNRDSLQVKLNKSNSEENFGDDEEDP